MPPAAATRTCDPSGENEPPARKPRLGDPPSGPGHWSPPDASRCHRSPPASRCHPRSARTGPPRRMANLPTDNDGARSAAWSRRSTTREAPPGGRSAGSATRGRSCSAPEQTRRPVSRCGSARPSGGATCVMCAPERDARARPRLGPPGWSCRRSVPASGADRCR